MNDPNPAVDEDVHAQVARFLAFVRRVLRFWRVPAVVLVLGGIACALFLKFRAPTYRSETVILYSEGVKTAEEDEHGDASRSVAVRFKEILMSRAALDTVIREFRLYPEIRQTRGPVDAVEELRKHVEFRAPGGDTFSIAFTGASPTEAQGVTKRLGDLVIDRDSDLRKSKAIIMRDFLDAEERTTEADLRDKEQALAAFMGAHPRFAFDATPLQTGVAIRASVAPAAPARPAGEAMKPRFDAAVGLGSFAGDGAKAPAPRAMSADESRAAAALAAARTNLAELMTRFTPAHPDVRAASAEVERAEQRLADARNGGTASSETGRAATAATRGDDVPATAAHAPPSPAPSSAPVVVRAAPRPAPAATGPATTETKEPAVVALETEWARLTRAVTEARHHQDQIEAALFKASIAASSESGGHGAQVSVIDPAFLPEKPVPPGRAAIAGIFLAASIVLGLAGAVMRALLDDGIYGSHDVVTVSPVLVEVPRLPRRARAAS